MGESVPSNRISPFSRVRSRTVVLPFTNIDTDQIYPARYLTTTSKKGLGAHLFADWRYLADGSINPEFALNLPEAQNCQILVTGRNLGGGSSREHAPWALLDYGFNVVVSTEIADIFRANCLKNGVLPVAVDESTGAWLLGHPSVEIDVSLKDSHIILPDGRSITFEIDGFARHCLLNGLDELGYLLSKRTMIERFERDRKS